MTLDECIADALSRGDVEGAVAALAAVGFGAAQRWCVDANFTGAHLATNMRKLAECARPALAQLTPEGIERERRYRAHCAAVVEAHNLVRMGYDAGGWPVAVAGECMRRFGLSEEEFRTEAGIASADGIHWKPSERIEAVVRECTLADVRRVRSLLLEHAPGEAALLAACDRAEEYAMRPVFRDPDPEPLTLEWLERAVRGFALTYDRRMGGVMAVDFTVSVWACGDAWRVYLSSEHGRRAGGPCSTRGQFREMAHVVGLPLRESELTK